MNKQTNAIAAVEPVDRDFGGREPAVVDKSTVRQKLNIGTLEKFRGFLEENPEKGKLHLQVKAIYEGHAGRSTVHVGPYGLDEERVDRPTRHYTFPFGAWREVEEMTGVEGPTDRIEPVEMTLAAMAACLVNSITVNAARLGISTSGLEINIKTTVDPRVMLDLKDPDDQSSCLGTIEYDVEVADDVSDEDLKTIRKLCRHSPVHGLIEKSIDISGEVRRA
ncbi:MAG: hypothetical protein GKS02_01265 [Alphaproteobacteria bacterium]|nr:hypothetical protein [Alphaproteobacteria bacterium]